MFSDNDQSPLLITCNPESTTHQWLQESKLRYKSLCESIRKLEGFYDSHAIEAAKGISKNLSESIMTEGLLESSESKPKHGIDPFTIYQIVVRSLTKRHLK